MGKFIDLQPGSPAARVASSNSQETSKTGDLALAVADGL